jgi:hypothetical protein
LISARLLKEPQYELQIEIVDVVADDAVNIRTEGFHVASKLRQDNSLIAVQRPRPRVPADHATLDFAVRRLVNGADSEKAAEVAIQSCLEVVLVRQDCLYGWETTRG